MAIVKMFEVIIGTMVRIALLRDFLIIGFAIAVIVAGAIAIYKLLKCR